MMNIFLWYSLNAYNDGVTEYIYKNSSKQEIIYNMITKTKKIPSDSNYKDYVLCECLINTDQENIWVHYTV